MDLHAPNNTHNGPKGSNNIAEAITMALCLATAPYAIRHLVFYLSVV